MNQHLETKAMALNRVSLVTNESFFAELILLWLLPGLSWDLPGILLVCLESQTLGFLVWFAFSSWLFPAQSMHATRVFFFLPVS
jgi:hypothetical protein